MQITNTGHQTTKKESTRHLGRMVFFVFLITFILSRITVFLIMARRIPDFYFHLQGTHIHHLNYGIFLLSGIGAYLLFRRPRGLALNLSAIIYGIGLALTFDEFGMWLHLGGSYWQRASFDGVIVIGGILGLISFAPPIQRFQPTHWRNAAIAVLFTAVFFFMLKDSFRYSESLAELRLRGLELAGPK